MLWERIARASTHPLQVEILERMAHDAPSPHGWSPLALSQATGAPLGNVSYHVRQLSGKGLLRLAMTEPRRGAVIHFYRLA